MKKIELIWEKENIGKKSVEFRFDGSECISEIDSDICDNLDYEYQICRIPASNMELVYFLQKHGFVFSETAFELSASLKKVVVSDVYKPYIEMMNYHKAGEEEIKIVEDTIRKGVFKTDRIALDPFFSLEKSGNRYGNWFVQEMKNKTTNCYIVEAEETPIGFFVLKEETNNISNSFLAALFNEQNIGMGFATIYFPLVQAKAEEKKRIVTHVSSNNIDSLKTHLEVGYKINGISYCFIKHLKQ